MSDDVQTPETDTSAPADTPEGTGSIDWEPRYKEAQAWGTREAQQRAELHERISRYEDPEKRAELFRELAAEQGYELQDPEDDTQYTPDEPWSQQLSQYEKRIAAMEARDVERQQAQDLARVESIVDRQLNELPNVDKDEQDWIVARAIAMPPAQDGAPDIKGAYDQFVALTNAQQKKWMASKKAPHVSPGGQAGTQQPNLDNEQERHAWMAQRLADLNAE